MKAITERTHKEWFSCLFICSFGGIAFIVACFCLPSLAFSEQPGTAKTLETSASADLKDIEDRWTRVKKFYSILQSRLNQAKLKSAPDLEVYQHTLDLVERFAMPYSEFVELGKDVSGLRSQHQPTSNIPSSTSLEHLSKKLQKIEQAFLLIEQSIQADLRAAQTRKDSRMYYMMRMKTTVPVKAQRAYGLMEIARKKRDLGQFQEALSLWEHTEEMIQESFDDHAKEMAKWRDINKKKAAKRRAKTKAVVEQYLKEYFVKIPGATFQMGSTSGSPDEQPVHQVTIQPFYLGNTEVTFELYDLCRYDTGCYNNPADMGWGREDHPVINVSHRDITKRFLPWLNKITGEKYRLPSEAEWEYAARAGSTSKYSWGENLLCSQARFDGGPSSICNTKDDDNQGTYPVKSFRANDFGLYDMHGNVWEWVEDCWTADYQNAPTDGSVQKVGNCNARVLRGGAWDSHKYLLRSSSRFYFSKKSRKSNFGFRIAKDAK